MRKLASLRIVEDVRPIPEADKIELILIDGWQVVSQKGNFKPGDQCVYFEIDSMLPLDTPVGKSLPADKSSSYNTEEKGKVDGFRIRTIKLRGQISQGYALPLKYFEDYADINLEAEDLTLALGVLKYEPPFNGSGSGSVKTKGNFPTDYVSKSDQERAQNFKQQIYDHYLANTLFEISYKLDGSSMTVGSYEIAGEREEIICSRNLSLKLDDEESTSQFISVGKPILERMKDTSNIVLQGELLSPSIQGNFEGVKVPCFYVYNVWSVKDFSYLPPQEAKTLVEQLSLNYVPLDKSLISLKELFGDNVESDNDLLNLLLEYAEGPSGLNGKYREGFVYKSEDGSFSFKTISNRYLLKEK